MKFLCGLSNSWMGKTLPTTSPSLFSVFLSLYLSLPLPAFQPELQIQQTPVSASHMPDTVWVLGDSRELGWTTCLL